MIGIQALTGYLPTIMVNPQTLALDWVGFADVSQELTNILNKMISYRPIDRYSSAVEALQAIHNIKSFFSLLLFFLFSLPLRRQAIKFFLRFCLQPKISRT